MTTETHKTADTGATPGGGGTAGAADFDAILREYTEGTKPETKAGDVSKVLGELKPVIAFAQTELTKRHEDAQKADIDDAIKFVKEDEGIKDVDIPAKLIRGMLEAYALEDPSFADAFANRAKDKAGWQAKLADARKSVAGELKALNPAARVSSDVVAARAAVSGESATPPPREGEPSAEDMFRMSERDFQAYVAKSLARSPR